MMVEVMVVQRDVAAQDFASPSSEEAIAAYLEAAMEEAGDDPAFPTCELCMPACLERAPKLTSVSMILVCRSRYGSRVGRGGRRRSEAAIGGSGFSVLDHRALSVAASGLGTNRSWAAGGLGWNICGGNHGFPYPSDPEVVIDP